VNLPLHAAERCRGGVERLTGFQPRHHREPPRRASVEERFLAADERLVADRDRDVEGTTDFRAEEVGRRDADDRERDALDGERVPDRVSRAAETALPEAVADHRHRAVGPAAADIVGRRQRAAEHGRDAERVEHPAARPQAVDKLCLAAL
jgi:hypothetical protein